MTATSVQPPPDHTLTSPMPVDTDNRRAPEGDRALTVRADRTDFRWSVRVVLEGTTAATGVITDSVCVIIRDRTYGTFPVFTLWSDWQDISILATHITTAALTTTLRDAEAENLAAALLTGLEQDAVGCVAALTRDNAPAPYVRPITRRERQQHQLLHDIAWRV